MNKKDLIQTAAVKAGLTQSTIARALTAIIGSITESLDKKEPVLLIGFGKFSVRQRKARKGINPVTQTGIDIPAKEVIVFKASRKKK